MAVHKFHVVYESLIPVLLKHVAITHTNSTSPRAKVAVVGGQHRDTHSCVTPTRLPCP